LRADGVNLPEWGFKQGEVVCEKKANKDTSNIWNIELHENKKRNFKLTSSCWWNWKLPFFIL
jgi:dolichyl-phosphate-mannose--protein O-mannosyl transferase